MVKVVFLVEGDSEYVLINHLNKKNWFRKFNIKILANINVVGNGELCVKNIEKYIHQAKTFDPDKILILTDLDCDECVIKTKERLGDCDICVYVIAKKALESWILADTELLKELTKDKKFYCTDPETHLKPFEKISDIFRKYNIRGTGPSKPRFFKKILKLGFDIDRASNHTNISSLKYFIDKLGEL